MNEQRDIPSDINIYVHTPSIHIQEEREREKKHTYIREVNLSGQPCASREGSGEGRSPWHTLSSISLCERVSRHGKREKAISHIITPKLYTSAAESYGSPCRISGANHSGLSITLVASCAEKASTRDTPKSATLAVSSPCSSACTRTFKH
jgi:hypothetical protein